MMLFLNRAARAVSRRGLGGLIVHAARLSYRRLFLHEQIIYELSPRDAAMLDASVPQNVGVIHIRNFSDLTAASQRDLLTMHDPAFLEYVQATLESGASLFLVTLDGAVSSLVWAKRGDLVESWYVPLTSEDVVLYGWFTSPDKRGRGLIKYAIASATRAYQSEARRFLADVRVWNMPSIRAMESVGFRLVCKVVPR